MIERTLSVGSRSRPVASERGRTPPIFRCRGFTLVEVLMSVVLMAIGVALALPSYRDMVEKRQVTNGAEQLASFINSAQGVAMRTNRLIKVSWDHVDNNEWCVGATAVANLDDAPCDCTGADDSAPTCAIDGQDFLLNQASASNRDLMQDIGSEGTGSYTFDPIRGFSPDLAGNLTFAMRSPSGDFRLNLVVNEVGRVLLCSEDASHAIPGYAVCNGTEVAESPVAPIGIDDPVIGEEPGPIEQPDPLPEEVY
jgi:type IV fimbrial biogenesis protein FimT